MLFKKLSQKIKNRKFNIDSIPIQYIQADEAKNFLFFQFMAGNSKFFFEKHHKCDIKIIDTPHYKVAKNHNADQIQKTNSKNEYIEYLRNSWTSYGLKTSQEKMEEKYLHFSNLISKIQKNKEISEPIIITKIPGFHNYHLVDGNHRCSIGIALQIKIPIRVLDFITVFDKFMDIKEFYGTGNKNMPYHSIYLNNKIIRQGRRDDIYDRINLLPDNILNGKKILDVGSNIGMNSIAAFKNNAKEVVGLEISQQMVNYATRFAMLDGVYPGTQFRRFDINEDILPTHEKYDLAFMLSIHHHLKDYRTLTRIANDNVLEGIIFEGHPNTEKIDYEQFFKSIQFSTIEELGKLGTSVFNRSPSRPLWLLRK